MSLGTWYIVFTKLWDQYRLGKSVKNVEKTFWAASSAREGADRLPKDDDFRTIAESAIRAAQHHEGRLGDRISLRDWLAMALQRAVDGLNSKLSAGLSFLATVGSTAPFVGLFGTVYGILKALISIGLSGQPSIDKVAGPVGEALIMTAIGLAVAVPAVFAYNILLRRNGAIRDSMREFTGDLEANLIGGVRPEISHGAKPAAAKPAAAAAAPAARK
ncbi:MAG: MotA/TolQ/ExbB proton channel family protein [Nevskiaceae bacterium]|nr:MotA/TolQ/ExbB proton channel family protein [Nevskiaceae bacterium]